MQICSSEKINPTCTETSEDDVNGGGGEETRTTTTGDEVTPPPLEDIEDEEDVDFSQATTSTHRKMKTNRLITEDELPDWLKNDVEAVEKTLENDEDFGKGRRQRKDVDYSDNLTEREFLQALEEGNLDDAVEQKRQRKQSRKSQLNADGDLDLDENEARSSFDNPPTPNVGNRSSLSATKRGSVKKRCASVDPKIAPQCRALLDRLLVYRTDDNRVLAQPFVRLPGQKQLPIYYQTIEDPVDFQRIRRKIDTFRYSSMEEFDADIELLVRNAQTFNCETSLIYADSILIEKVYRNLREQLDAGQIEIAPATKEEPVSEPVTTATTTTESNGATPRTSTRRARGTRTSTTPTTPNPEVSKRGRKRKLTVVKDEEQSDADQAAAGSDNEEFQ